MPAKLYSALYTCNRFAFFALIFMVWGLVSCSPKVRVVSNDQQIYLSGRWNSTDSHNTGIAIADQVLSEPWLSNYTVAHGQKKPVLICGTIQNKSHEHIDAETFRKDIERALVNSGRVRLVQDAQKRGEIREERVEQQQFSTTETQKKLAAETGADFILQGSINSIVDENKKQRVTYYQINLTLTEVESNEVVWIGEKKITKLIDR